MEFNQTLTPAYGRDYKSQAAVYDDLNADKDFVCNPSGQYTNRADLIGMGYTKVWIRYGKRMTKAQFDLR